MNVTQLLSDLATDRIISLAQVKRHYGLAKKDLSVTGLKLHAEYISLTATRKRHPLVEFVTLIKDRSIRRKRAPELRHLAATAELRHLVGAKTKDWTVVRDGIADASLPDARWEHPNGYNVAIEYDAGSYPVSRIVEKTETWRAEAKEQIWGSNSRRVGQLRKYLGDDVVIYTLDNLFT